MASSRITNFDFLRIALLIHISYFSPLLKLDPFSLIFRFIPSFWLFTIYSNWLSFKISKISSLLNTFYGSKLNLKEPVKIVGSYGIRVILLLKSYRFIYYILILSISIWPSKISTILQIAYEIVLFPAPVLPTIPIFIPFSTLKEIFFNTISVFVLYLKLTFLNSILPNSGQLGLLSIKDEALSRGKVFFSSIIF